MIRLSGNPKRRRSQCCWLALATLLLACPVFADTAVDDTAADDTAADDTAADDTAADDTAADGTAHLPQRYREWLRNVEPLILEAEREVFLQLHEDYQREEFIRRFWKVRDPFPQTALNELRERWEERILKARELFGDELSGDPARMLLTFGEPSRRMPVTCEITETLDVWFYDDGSDVIRGFFNLVFIGYRPRSGDARLWQPRDGLRDLFRLGSRPFSATTDPQLAEILIRECSRGSEIVSALAQSLDVEEIERRSPLLPRPNEEWVRSFKARTTDLPDDAELMSGELRLSYPGRHQSRTVVQGLVTLPRSEVGVNELGPSRTLNLLVDGDVLRQEELFDQFRYRFDFPAAEAPEVLPLVVQRYLRPGSYELIVRVEDIATQRFFREARQLEVPRVDVARRPVEVRVDSGPGPGPDPEPGQEAEAGTVLRTRTLGAATVEERLGEANAAISTGDHTVKILALPDLLMVGKLRVEARVRGEGVSRVAFLLNGRPVMRKSAPPYSVELDLGDQPRVHTLEAIALDGEGRKLASDEVLVNGGPHRFAVRLVEPQAGQTYSASVRAHAEVEVPEGEHLERVELYLNDLLVATLYQPPFELPMLISGDTDLAYVRAVAHLRNGESTEDVVFVNAPDFVDEMRVHLVELFTTVTDRKGNFVEDLRLDEITVLEDGDEQTVRRFEKMRDLPIRAGLVIDTSTSMSEELGDVKKAAHHFLETVISDRDRAAIITFADEPHLAVRFTNDQEVLAGGLAGLVTEGETALYDSVIYGLHYFSGLRGKRALVILTDGEDSSSHYTYNDAVDFGRRTGVAVYVIGLSLPTDQMVRSKIRTLAHETGGDCFFIERVSHLRKVYDTIQQELRSQYLVAYQSSQVNDRDDFRRVEIRLSRRGVDARTIRGYFP